MINFFSDRSLPAEIFEDYKEELEERYSRDKKKLKDILQVHSENNYKKQKQEYS
jgi:ribosomal protein S17E